MSIPTNTVSLAEFGRLCQQFSNSSAHDAAYGYDEEYGTYWLRVTKLSDNPAEELNTMYKSYKEQHQ